MAKVRINGEHFEWDRSKRPISEAIAIEIALKDHFANYGQWEQALSAGSSAIAHCGLVWLVWRRNGRDVPIEDILSGKVDYDLNEIEWEGNEQAGPTTPPPEASSTTDAGTSARSAK